MKIIIFCLFIFSTIGLLANEKSLLEQEREVINYSNIKKVLQNDGLMAEKKKKDKIIKAIKGERKKIKAGRYNTPSEDDFLNNMSELWLVRNAQLLRWDFPKPEYGVGSAFKQLLEKFGFFNEHFKVLIINSPTITHFGLPAGKGKAIFILSLPFIRSLDLTKVDISLLLLEDFVRLQKKLFVRKLGVNKEFYNHNFYRKGIDKKVVNQAMTDYTRVIFKEGFNFQEQFEVTKTMDRYLKSAPSLWSAYFKLYKKIDRFIKADLLYKDYLKIYPSPELQLQWLSPKKKMI